LEYENTIFLVYRGDKINILMDDPSLSEEVKLVEIGQGAHTTAEHQNPSPFYVFIRDEQEKKLVN
jgi:hypothetical protein